MQEGGPRPPFFASWGHTEDIHPWARDGAVLRADAAGCLRQMIHESLKLAKIAAFEHAIAVGAVLTND
jgi:hypothetical protein